MTGGAPDDEIQALLAAMRSAVQHRRAEYERMLERQRDLEEAIGRARRMLEARRSGEEADRLPTDPS
jgi:hypothetical protein